MSSLIAHSPWSVLFGVNGGTKAVFFRQLATMIQAGLPVGRAVSTASEVGLRKVGSSLVSMIEKKGSTLSEAMARFPHHFSRCEVAIVRAGEKSGQMDRQLEELATAAEQDWQMQKKITSKMVYPLLVAHAAVLLPPLVLLVSSGLAAYLKAILTILVPAYCVAAGLFLSYRFFKQSGGPRRLMDTLLSTAPLIGGPKKLGARIRFLRTLASLIEAGFLPSQALPLAADSCDNFWLRDKVMPTWNKLGKEVTLSQVMRLSGAFESFEIGLVVSGEEAGSFSATLKRASESLRPEYDAQVHRLMTVLPIVMLLFVGGLVGFVVINTMAGIFAPVSDLMY
ncbi:MAG: type II secretion system F family protein [Vulcanimicrobiota bacterium]